MGVCKLCLKESTLLKRSHIIPDFMYEPLYDEHHKINVISPLQHIAGNKKVKKPSSGEYEGNLLCSNCDNILLSELENYGSKVIHNADELGIKKTLIKGDGVVSTKFENVDYTKFKLFLLSILWRASISTRPVFSEVNLGPHEEIIRKMLLLNDAKTRDIYPILGIIQPAIDELVLSQGN